WNDRTTFKANATISSPSALHSLNLIQHNIGTQKLQSNIKRPTFLAAYYNGSFQNSYTWSGTHNNTNFLIGAQFGLQGFLNGYIQLIKIYDTDVTSQINEVHTEINNYYNIY
ncbi:unnamed protein product, partial [marine sediment metagenome]